jgi:nucleoid-associated protein YgaU
MKFSPALLAALCAALFTATATAQLKLPRNAAAPAVPAAPAAPAAAAQPAPTSESAEKQAAGKLAAQGWLLLLDRRDWGRAWETTSGMFRASVPLGAWMDGIPKVREPLGPLVERTPAESVYKTTLEGRPNGDYVTTIFVSKFDKRELQEVVTAVREPDGKWRVTGYSTR